MLLVADNKARAARTLHNKSQERPFRWLLLTGATNSSAPKASPLKTECTMFITQVAAAGWQVAKSKASAKMIQVVVLMQNQPGLMFTPGKPRPC